MNIRNFVLSYYKNSTLTFHIHKVENSREAKKPHSHEYYQIYFIASGSLTHHLEEYSSRLAHGDMFIIPPGKMHYISPEKDTVFYSFSFMPDFLKGSDSGNLLCKNFLDFLDTDSGKSIRPKISVAPEEIIYIENILAHMLREFTEKPMGYAETVHAYALVLVTMLARSYFEKAKSVPSYFEDNRQRVLHCVRYIEANFAEDISLETVSRESAMGKTDFCRLFSEITGYSFNKYLNLCRIKKAASLIREGYQVTAVSGLCGYNDFSTFYRNFKKILGVSPKEYKNGGNHE